MSRKNQTYSEQTLTLPITQPVAQVSRCNKVLRAADLLFMVLLMTLFIISATACTSDTENGGGTDDTQGVSDTTHNNEESSKESKPETDETQPPVIIADTLAALSVTDYVVVSTRRTGRTRTEYTLKIKVANSSSTTYEIILATLVSAPAHITVIDSIVNFTRVPPHSTTISPDTFTVDVDLAVSTSFDDLVWNFEGDVITPPPPPPHDRPTQTGYFMNIDNNQIPGESTSSSHRDWIVLSAFTEGLHRDDTGATGSTRRRSSFVFDGVTVSKLLDRSSPKLREALAEGRFFGEVKIDIIATCGGNLYTAYANTLSTAQIVALTLTGSEQTPTENVGLIYSRIETMYTPVADDCTLLPPVFSTQDGELLRL